MAARAWASPVHSAHGDLDDLLQGAAGASAGRGNGVPGRGLGGQGDQHSGAPAGALRGGGGAEGLDAFAFASEPQGQRHRAGDGGGGDSGGGLFGELEDLQGGDAPAALADPFSGGRAGGAAAELGAQLGDPFGMGGGAAPGRGRGCAADPFAAVSGAPTRETRGRAANAPEDDLLGGFAGTLGACSGSCVVINRLPPQRMICSVQPACTPAPHIHAPDR